MDQTLSDRASQLGVDAQHLSQNLGILAEQLKIQAHAAGAGAGISPFVFFLTVCVLAITWSGGLRLPSTHR